MKVTVQPINSISVKVNQENQKVVFGTSTFNGAATTNIVNVQIATAAAYNQSNIAIAEANVAINLTYAIANTVNVVAGNTFINTNAFSVTHNGVTTFSVGPTGNVYIGGAISANLEIIDCGLF